MAFKKLNYQKLMASNPTLYKEVTNSQGQIIELVEHPTEGDDYPVIAVYHKEKIAVVTDFFDTADFWLGSDYMPVYMHGELQCAWEVDAA